MRLYIIAVLMGAAAIVFRKWSISSNELGIIPEPMPFMISHLYQILTVASFSLLLLFLCSWMSTIYKEHRRVAWWNPRRVRDGDPLTWTGAFELAALDWSNDPLGRAEERKKVTLIHRTFEIVTSTVTIFSLATAVDFILNPLLPNFIKDTPQNTLHDIVSNLTGYLAIITALIAIYIARFSIRAQVRSKSRQKWINKVRDLIAELISDIDLKFTGKRVNNVRINQNRIQLELLLNPSEKDHRLLSMLLRVCLQPGLSIDSDKYVIYHWEMINLREKISNNAKPLFDIIRGGKVGKLSQEKAISYIIKLSSAVLKREWERVRQTR